jgi:hypothetical protein
MTSKKLCIAVVVAISLITLIACDLQKAALKIFTNQGLSVLQPARDYIALGGIVVLPKKGRPLYVDPYDTLTGTEGTYSNFSAVIQQQTQNQSTGIEAAVGTLASFIPVPAGLKFSTGQQVQLSQIDTGGTRLTTQMVLSLLKKNATSAAILAQLQAGNRVFLVQEVYTAKSMDLKSASNMALDVSYGSSASLPTCNASSTPSSSGTAQPSTGASNAGTAGASGKATTGTSASAPKSNLAAGNSPASGTGGTGNKGTGAGAASSNSSANAGNTGGVGISVGVCRASQYEISFQSQTPLPFAVRLNEVVVKAGGILDLNYTNFTIPGALGAGDVSATAIVDSAYPMLEDMEHVQH